MANNNALIKLTQERIDNNNQLQTFVQQARAVANVIFPETLPFSDKYNKLGAEVVTVDAKNDKHVYPNDSGTYSLHLSKLNEIAKAAKIRTVDSRILERKTDENGRVTFISHQVTVQYRTISGEMITESYTGKYDYFRDLDSLGKGDPKNKQVNGRRKHAEALAESNALTRAFNKVLPQLPQAFKLEDLNKPFLIPYVEEDKNALLNEFSPEEQKEIKKQMARKKLGIVDDLYSPPAGYRKEETTTNNSVPESEPSANNNVEDAKVIEETLPTPSAQDNAALAQELRYLNQPERTAKIMQLMRSKNYSHPNVTITESMIEKSTLEKQINFYETLLNYEGGLPE